LRENRRLTTEECRVLEIGPLVCAGIFREPLATSLTIAWPDMVGCEHVGLEGVLYRWAAEEWLLTLRHSIAHSSLPEPLALPISLRITSNPCNYGGSRFWLRCPQVREGRLICRRKVAKLFLIPGGSCFGCRDCLNLTYRSAQSHDSRLDKLLKNPFLFHWALTSPKRSLMFLGLKAYRKLVERLNRKAVR